VTEPAPTPERLPAEGPRLRAAVDAYWRRNVRLMAVLLALWAAAGLGCGALFADRLNQLSLGGFPLGFWFAQQGSVLAFVALIAAYAVAMDRLDRRHHAELEALARSEASREA
jgi:putative solute:sodium symporter small subunit